MTLDEAIELGRAWASWEWLPGQWAIDAGREEHLVDLVGTDGIPWSDDRRLWGAVPDFRDPGTRGHALEQVREAWGAPRSMAYPPRQDGGEWSVGGFVPGDDGACVFAYGATEAAALLAARRAAP